MADFIRNLQIRYQKGNMLVKLLFINIGFFCFIQVLGVITTLFKFDVLNIARYLSVPSAWELWRQFFWTPFTYMFVHESFWHIAMNMLWLYWFGKIFLHYFTGKNLGSLYLLGGLAGALLYVLCFTFIPYYVDMGNRWLLGASASVMAITMAAAFYRPDVTIRLFLLGNIRIIYIAIGVFVLDFFSLDDAANAGGHVAHIGGAAIGYLFAMQYKKGKDITQWMSRLMDGIANLFKKRTPKPKMKVTSQRRETDREYNYRKHQEQEAIDAILDKLKKSGYGSLSSDEKKRLFDASKK